MSDSPEDIIARNLFVHLQKYLDNPNKFNGSQPTPAMIQRLTQATLRSVVEGDSPTVRIEKRNGSEIRLAVDHCGDLHGVIIGIKKRDVCRLELIFDHVHNP